LILYGKKIVRVKKENGRGTFRRNKNNVEKYKLGMKNYYYHRFSGMVLYFLGIRKFCRRYNF